ncbi:hypothetical protein GUITHDRAFT_54982, partial [Guillardia theta CCMP2712]
LLECALENVHQHGWTVQALSTAAMSMGLSPSIHGIFPSVTCTTRGAVELVEFFQEKCHAEWLTELRAMDTSTMSYPDVLTKILFMRLVKLAPYVSSWPQAIAILAFPSNLPGAVATLARTSDVACVQAGDGNVDASWFSKRIAVGGLYVGAEFYMLTDYSEDFKDTEDFIRRQVS